MNSNFMCCKSSTLNKASYTKSSLNDACFTQTTLLVFELLSIADVYYRLEIKYYNRYFKRHKNICEDTQVNVTVNKHSLPEAPKAGET